MMYPHMEPEKASKFIQALSLRFPKIEEEIQAEVTRRMMLCGARLIIAGQYTDVDSVKYDAADHVIDVEVYE